MSFLWHNPSFEMMNKILELSYTHEENLELYAKII